MILDKRFNNKRQILNTHFHKLTSKILTISDYFQFFPPFGEDRDRLLVELTPSSSVIKPFEVLTITATLICCDIGCIQNYFLPCFIGVGQEPLVLRVLCTVDGPHVVFYLPVEKRHLKKVTWPPKIVYEYDTDPYCICRDVSDKS